MTESDTSSPCTCPSPVIWDLLSITSLNFLYLFFYLSIEISSISFTIWNPVLSFNTIGITFLAFNSVGYLRFLDFGYSCHILCQHAAVAKNNNELNILLFRSLIITTFFVCIPACVLMVTSGLIFQGFGFNAELSSQIQFNMIRLIPALFASNISMCLNNWLKGQFIFLPSLLITVLIAIFHPVWTFTFVNVNGMDYEGLMYAVSITRLIEAILYILYIHINLNPTIQPSFTKKTFQNWIQFFKIAVFHFSISSDRWIMDACIIIAALLLNSSTSLSVMLAYDYTSRICHSISKAFQLATITVIGNSLDKSEVEVSKSAARYSILLSISLMVTTSILLFLLFKYIASTTIKNENFLLEFNGILPIICTQLITDGLKYPLLGILEGIGKQKIAIPCVLLSYLVIALPLSLCLALPWGFNLGTFGLCVGIVIGSLVHCVLYLIIVFGLSDWDLEAKRIPEKNRRIQFLNSQSTHELLGYDEVNDDEDDLWIELSTLSALSQHPTETRPRNSSDKGQLLDENGEENSEHGRESRKQERKTTDSLQLKNSTEPMHHKSGGVVHTWLADSQRYFGFKNRPSDYELVRDYTSSLSESGINIEDSEDEYHI